MKLHLILLILIAAIFGCTHHKANKNAVTQHLRTKTETLSKKTISSDTLVRYTGPDDTVPKVVIPDGTIQVATHNQPVDTINKSYLLEAVLLNKDEIEPVEMKLPWKGLFFRKDRTAYIKNTRLAFEPAQSETDEEGQKTGWQVKCDNKDDGYFLSGINDLAEGPVQRVTLIQTTLYPGEKQEFTYNGVSYTIYARGFKKDGDIYNYKLFLLANIKGHYFNQLLASEEHFGDQMHWEADAIISINFVGDIDGDRIPDLIISRSAEFSGDSYLLLSKSAGDNAILKDITSFGTSD